MLSLRDEGRLRLDDHVVEPPNVWQDRLPSKYAEVGPRVVRAPMPEVEYRGGSLKVKPGSEGVPVDWWYYEDLKRPLLRVDSAVGVPREEVTMKGVTFEDMRPGSYSVKPRLEDMDLNHIEATLCFPTFPRFCGQTFTEAKDKELGLLCVKAYNDWMVEEWCGESNGRLIPLTLIPLWDAELAADRPRRGTPGGDHGGDGHALAGCLPLANLVQDFECVAHGLLLAQFGLPVGEAPVGAVRMAVEGGDQARQAF